jgi:hypothetical protein
MHRIKFTKLTEAQITAKLGAVAGPTSASPLSDVLAGKVAEDRHRRAGSP